MRRAFCRPSLPKQDQISGRSVRTIRTDAIRDDDPKAVRIEAHDSHPGRRVAIKRLRPFDRQVEVGPHLTAGELSRPDPRARIRAGDLARTGGPGQTSADRSRDDQISPACALKRQTRGPLLQDGEAAADLVGIGIRPLHDGSGSGKGAGVEVEDRRCSARAPSCATEQENDAARQPVRKAIHGCLPWGSAI
jgi:hypothetical protein